MAVPGPRSVLYKGIMVPDLVHSKEGMRYSQLGFQVPDNDVFIGTYLKSDPSLSFNPQVPLLSLIHSAGDPQLAQSVPCWERLPWLEQTTVARYLENQPSPLFISSHLSCSLFPTSIHGSNAKVIYTVRNPKNVCVSLYYYSKMASFLEVHEDLGEFVELFNAELFRSWFQHVKGWPRLRDWLNFLFLTYEEPHQDLQGSVERICQFLSRELDVQALDAVVENTFFQSMKQKMCNYSLVPENIMDQRLSPFPEKRIPLRLEGHFMSAQSVVFDQLYQEQMQDVGIRFPWGEA